MQIMNVNNAYSLDNTEQLIQDCIIGNRNAQRFLYEKFVAKMYGICLRYSKNRNEAEEILQEGFMQVFKSLTNFKNQGSFEGWIKKIMVYSSIQHYRSKSKLYLVQSDANYLEGLTTSEEDIISRLAKKELLQLIQALPPACRLIFNLYVFEGMKHREIAEQLGISEGTSKSNFFDAKILLQKAVANSMKIAKNY